jgi:formate dehydrogenase (NADP+) beta subunit
MSMTPHDLTPIYKATIAKGTNAVRWQRPEYVSHLPPCNNACPAGLNIQAWLALAQAGRYEDAWRQYMQDNPLPATHGRACYHPCENACNRQFLDSSVAIHSLDRFLGDLAIDKGWTGPPVRRAASGSSLWARVPRGSPAPTTCDVLGTRSRSATAARSPVG